MKNLPKAQQVENKLLEQLQELNERLDTALREADGSGLQQCLRELADLDIDPTLSVYDSPKVPTEHENLNSSIIKQFQYVIRTLSWVVSDNKRKADTSTKAQYPSPLTFTGRWNGKSPTPLIKEARETSVVRKYVERVHAEYPNVDFFVAYVHFFSPYL